MPATNNRIRRTGIVRAHIAVAAAVVALQTSALGQSLNMPTVRAWGLNNFGQTDVPQGLTDVKQIAAGTCHTVALKRDGTVVAWGAGTSNDDCWPNWGQSMVPVGLTGVCQIAAKSFHTLAAKLDGSVVAWGLNNCGQTTVPAGLREVIQVAAGGDGYGFGHSGETFGHSLALRSDGTVVAWGAGGDGVPDDGWRNVGQSKVPVALSDVRQVTASRLHSFALKANGSIAYWGWRSEQFPFASNLTSVSAIAAGTWHGIALKADGSVWIFSPGNPSAFQHWLGDYGTKAASITAGGDSGRGDFFLVVTADDRILPAFSQDYYGELTIPNGLSGVVQLAAGGSHSIALYEGDCDADGTLDATAVAQNFVRDDNANLIPDSCELARGWEEDCNANNIIDSYEQQLNQTAAADSGQLARIGTGHPQQWVYASPSFSLDDPVLTISVKGDFSAPGETLTITLNGRFVGTLFATGSDKNDCRASITRTITLPRTFYNECVSSPGGAIDAAFDFTTSVAVNADQCPAGSWVRAQISYTAAVQGDCNANSLLDTCEIALDPSIDGNTDGVIDACQGMGVVFDCPGDLDGGGSVDYADLSLLLMNFGFAMPGDPSDIDGDGHIDTADISLLLLNFGEC